MSAGLEVMGHIRNHADHSTCLIVVCCDDWPALSSGMKGFFPHLKSSLENEGYEYIKGHADSGFNKSIMGTSMVFKHRDPQKSQDSLYRLLLKVTGNFNASKPPALVA